MLAKERYRSLGLSPFAVCVLMCSFIDLHRCLILRQNKQISSHERLFRDVFETLQVKSSRYETAAGTHKTETFTIPRVVMVRMYSKEAIFDFIFTKEDIVDALPVDDDNNIEEVSEATVTEIDDFRN